MRDTELEELNSRAAVNLRPVTQADTQACGRIIYQAFHSLAQRHNFPPDFPSVEAATGLAQAFIGHPAIYGVVAERDGQVLGSNFLIEYDEIRAVGPITVDPSCQAHGIGRQLMEAVIGRGAGAAGVRLVQDAFNTASMPLYARLGFEAREPLALMRGKPATPPSGNGVIRPMEIEDLPACAALCRAVHGIDRTNELKEAVGHFSPLVLWREQRVMAYLSAPTFWPLNHGVARNESDMWELLRGAGALNSEPLSFLLPIRLAGFFRWCLGEGLRVVKPMTLMVMGRYQEPVGCYFPSVFY